MQASPDKWLKENLTTPELMRVRGSLSAKLDVIKIEKRKGFDIFLHLFHFMIIFFSLYAVIVLSQFAYYCANIRIFYIGRNAKIKNVK